MNLQKYVILYLDLSACQSDSVDARRSIKISIGYNDIITAIIFIIVISLLNEIYTN